MSLFSRRNCQRTAVTAIARRDRYCVVAGPAARLINSFSRYKGCRSFFPLSLRPQIYFPVQPDPLLFLHAACDQLGRVAGDEVRHKAREQIAQCEREKVLSPGKDAVSDTEPQEKFRRVDVLENPAVCVAVVTCRGKISRFVALRQVASHGNCHRIAENHR